MKRVTSQPSGSTKATTSGPTPTDAAVCVASCSAARSIPSTAVSRPATRSTKTPSERVTFTLWFVIPPLRTSHVERAVRPDARDGGVELRVHARIRSPAGSYSGSSATTPGTHSPKISTATSVPTSCPAGRYAKAIDDPTV